MTAHYPCRRECRIYDPDELQDFNPSQPFSTAGGYADLFRTVHGEDGELALKRLRWGDGDLTDRFALATKEATVWQVLKHPNILAFLGILYSESHIYLVSPFASYGSLPQYLKAHPDADRTTFIPHIVAGLKYLHSQNIVHGDVKGANILVSQKLTAQLCDFGLSKFADTPTSSGPAGRSLPWLSPERMDHADLPQTSESDVYAFGMTIYEILSGRIPFHTLSANDLMIAVCIRDERPPQSPEFSTAGTSYLPLWLMAADCWNKDPQKRLSMEQVYDCIATDDKARAANADREDTPMPQPSSHTMTQQRGRISNTNVNTASGWDMLQQFVDMEESRILKRLKPRDSITNASWSAQEQPEKNADPWLIAAVDDVNVALSALCDPLSNPPYSTGSIMEIMAATGLAIIDMLKNVKENRGHAMELGRHIGTLIQCAARFLESPVPGLTEGCDLKTSTQLHLFQYALKALEHTLTKFREYGQPHQGIPIQNNEDDLVRWEARINHAFAALQIQLSLHSLRLITNLSDASARLERDRLLSLLGDGDIGATERASSAVDLMCLPGTRIAVLDQVDQWIADPSGSRIFWISGVAGCGKTALAATVAGRPRAPLASIAAFYFFKGSQERNKRVLCSLSRQLAKFGHGSLEHFVLGAVKANPDIATSHLDTQFQHLLVDPLKKLVPGLPPVILVVDALDEWDNYKGVVKLVDLIRQAHTELPPNVRFVLASRNEPHLVSSIDSYLMRPLVTRYALDTVLKSDVGRDIRRYIEKHFAELCALSGFDIQAWPRTRDIENLVLLSDGLFQWAATVMSYIRARRSQGRLREILQNPERHRGLDNLYQGVLDASSREEMDERFPQLLQYVLGAILTAPSPRNAIAIAYLCCNELNKQEEQETREFVWEEVLPTLASMFIIPEDRTRPITISHKSVLDYLTNKDRCTDIRFYTDLTVHQERISNTCFRLMGSKLRRDICGINDPSKLNQDVQDQVSKHISPGLCYLCEHWVECLAVPGQGGFAVSRDHVAQFSRNHLLHWLEVMSLAGTTARVAPIADNVKRWLLTCQSLSLEDEITRRLWSDTQRFMTMFSEPISTAAAHIYVSALRLAPTGTQIVQQLAKTVERGVRITGSLQGEQWPPSAWTAKGHTDAVNCVSFSPDEKTILSGSWDKTLRLWDAESGALKGKALEGHKDRVTCISFSPDGRTIFSGSWDNTMRSWDAESGTQKGRTLDVHMGWVDCALFSPDGATILSGSWDNTLRLWDTESGTQKGRTLKGHKGRVTSASFSPDGETILSGSWDRTLRLWDAESGAQKGDPLEGHTGVTYCVSFSPDAKTIVSGSWDNTLRRWDTESGTQKGRALEGHMGCVECVSFSPDGKTIISGSTTGTLQLWDTESGAQKAATLKGHIPDVKCASFSPDGRTILSGSSDSTLRLWDADSGALRAEQRNGHTRGVSCFVFSPDGGTIVSGSYDKTVRLWDAETGFLRVEPLSADGAVSELSFSADGLTLIGKTYDGSKHEWDFVKYVRDTSNLTHRYPVSEGSVSPEGWIFHRDIRWFWVPFSYADWLLCGSRLALRRERVVYIFDVSEIMYIVE